MNWTRTTSVEPQVIARNVLCFVTRAKDSYGFAQSIYGNLYFNFKKFKDPAYIPERYDMLKVTVLRQDDRWFSKDIVLVNRKTWISPAQREVLIEHGKRAKIISEVTERIQFLEEVHAKYPFDKFLTTELVNSYFELRGRTKEREWDHRIYALVNEGLSYNPTDRHLCTQLAKYYYLTKQYVQARSFLGVLVAYYTNDAILLTELGQVNFRMKYFHDAYEQLTRAVELSKKKVPPRIFLAKIDLHFGRFDKARELLKEALREQPDNIPAYHILQMIEERTMIMDIGMEVDDEDLAPIK